MKALLLVDVQNDFLPDGALGVPHSDLIIPVINDLQSKFPCVVATKDWHPGDHISFAINHGKQPGEIIEVEGYDQELWPVHCVQESEGSDFAKELSTDAIKEVFYKGVDSHIDSYSAFYDNVHKRSTGLGDYLKELGVDEIYIAGIATNFCVKYSAFDALELGFKVHIIEDGCCGIELHPGDIEDALEQMRSKGANVILSSEL